MISEKTVLFGSNSCFIWDPFCRKELLNIGHPHCSLDLTLTQNILIAEVTYNINTLNLYRNDLLQAMVNLLNRLVSFPLQLSLSCEGSSTHRLVFRLNYLLIDDELEMVRLGANCGDWEKRFTLIVEMTDKVMVKMMELMREFEIKHSLYPKLQNLTNFLSTLPDLETNLTILNYTPASQKSIKIDMTACSLAERY